MKPKEMYIIHTIHTNKIIPYYINLFTLLVKSASFLARIKTLNLQKLDKKTAIKPQKIK